MPKCESKRVIEQQFPCSGIRRAMWLSAKRKELMWVFVRSFHYVVMAKHQLVVKALRKERRIECDLGPLYEREAIPEDLGVFGSLDEDGDEFLSPHGRAGEVRLVDPAPALPDVPDVATLAPLPPGMPPPPAAHLPDNEGDDVEVDYEVDSDG